MDVIAVPMRQILSQNRKLLKDSYENRYYDLVSVVYENKYICSTRFAKWKRRNYLDGTDADLCIDHELEQKNNPNYAESKVGIQNWKKNAHWDEMEFEMYVYLSTDW